MICGMSHQVSIEIARWNGDGSHDFHVKSSHGGHAEIPAAQLV